MAHFLSIPNYVWDIFIHFLKKVAYIKIDLLKSYNQFDHSKEENNYNKKNYLWMLCRFIYLIIRTDSDEIV